MIKHLRMLQARGYWAPADDGTGGTGGSGGGGGGGGGGEGNSGTGEGGTGEGEGSGNEPGKTGTKPSDAEAKLLKEVMDKKSKLQKATDDLAKLTEQLKKFEGLDPEQMRQMLADAEDRKLKDLEAKGQWDALKKQLVDQHGKALTDKDAVVKAIETKAATLASQIAELTVGNSFGNSKFIADNLALSVSKARTIYGAHFEFDGEKVVAFDKAPGAANRVVLVDAKGEPLGFEDAIKKLVEADPDRDQVMKSKVKAGAGSTTEPKVAGVPRKTVEVTGAGRIAAALTARKAGR